MTGENVTAVILPIFNQEKYLAKALDSLLAQTCADWHAFCVNDGSTDATAEILERYVSRDSRFTVITQPNSGVAAARNAGQEAALAFDGVTSILFVDPDDFLHPQCLEVARHHLDMAPNTVIEWDIREDLSEDEFLSRRYVPANVETMPGLACHTLWNKLFPRAVLERVRAYPPARIAQDLAFVLEVMHREHPEVLHLKAALYYYVANPVSTVHRRLKPSDFERIAALIEYVVFIHKDSEKALEWIGHCFLPSLMKRFYRSFRRVAPEDLRACRRIYGIEIASLRTRGLLHPLRGSFKDLKYYLRFLWLAMRHGYEPSRRKVFVDIAGLVNRGDQMMFDAIVGAVRRRWSDAELVVRGKLLERGSFARRVDVPIRSLVDTSRFGRCVEAAFRSISARLGLCVPPVWPQEIDLVLHAPGFRYSDQFPVRRKDSVVSEISRFRAFCKTGRRIVFLPQAFGPFESDDARRQIVSLAPLADWIYARERKSFEYLSRVLPNMDRVSVSPDFTCSCRGAMPPNFAAERYGVIVPNRKMISHTQFGESAYLRFLVDVARLFRRDGLVVVLLNHEGAGDAEIVNRLGRALGSDAVVFNDADGLVCKGIIRGATLVVTSRFHGAVSGLSQGVPTLCTSWSHKYAELAHEFGRPRCCLDLANPSAALGTVRDALSRPNDYAPETSYIRSVEAKVEKMWEDVLP